MTTKPLKKRRPVQKRAGVRDSSRYTTRQKIWLEEDLRPIGIGASLEHLNKLLQNQPPITQ